MSVGLAGGKASVQIAGDVAEAEIRCIGGAALAPPYWRSHVQAEADHS